MPKREMNREKITRVLCFIIAIFLALTMVGCGDRGKSKKTVVVYSPHGGDIMTQFESLFEGKYPDIDVQWIEVSSQGILDRIRSERENPQCDVWWGAPSTDFSNATKENLLQKYRPLWANAVDPKYKDTNDFWYGTFLTPEVIGYNNSLLKESEVPKDWDELLLPKWKDKIIIRYPLASGTMRAIFSAMIWRSYKDTSDPKNGYEWLLKLDANTKEYASSPTMMQQKLARGEGLLTIWNMPDMIFQADRYKYPFGYVIPKSGTPIVTDGIAMIANCKHPKEGKLYYEFVNTQESLLTLAKQHYRIPARNDMPKDQLPKWITETSLTPMDVNWDVFSQKSDEWMKYWEQNIKNKGK